MAFFKSDEEKLEEEQYWIDRHETSILNRKEYNGKVGHIHHGLSAFVGVWGTLKNDKIKYKSTKFKIHDTKLLIERNRTIIDYSDIKEIFQEIDGEAIIILDNGDGIPIKRDGGSILPRTQFKAFLNILNRLIEKNKANRNTNKSNTNTNTNSEDKFDKLIKLGEMHNQGLLSDEEFASLKQELLAEDTTPETNDEPLDVTCDNCGAEVSPEDAFCSECGTKIN